MLNHNNVTPQTVKRQPELFDRRFTRDRSYNIKQLWSSHEAALRMVASGLNNKQTAQVLNVTPQTVSNVRNSPAGRQRLMEYSSALDEQMLSLSSRFKEFAPEAESLLEDVVTGRIPAPISIRARYAADILDRAGHSAIKKVMSLSTTLTRSEIEDIKSRALQAARESGHLVLDKDKDNTYSPSSPFKSSQEGS